MSASQGRLAARTGGAVAVILAVVVGCKDTTGPVASGLSFITQPVATTAGATMSPSVQVAVLDASGNTVTTSTASVTLAITSSTGTGGAHLSGGGAVAAVAGVATFSALSIDSAGANYTLTATASSLTGATSSSFAVRAGPAARLAFTVQPSSVVAGAAMSPAVTVAILDALGNVTGSSASVALQLTPGSGKAGAHLSGTLTVAAVAGVATYSGLTVDSTATGYTMTATATGLASATSAGFTVAPGAPAKLAFITQPSQVTAGTAISPAVQVAILDAVGNRVPNDTASVTAAITQGTAPAGAQLGGSLQRGATGGTATFGDLTLYKAWSGYRLSASASGLASATSASFDVLPGAPTQLAFVAEPTAATATVVLSPAVQVAVQDNWANTVTGATNLVMLGITNDSGWSGAALSGTLQETPSAGIATFSDVAIDRLGTGYRLSGGALGLGGAKSDAFVIRGYAVGVADGDSFSCMLSKGGLAYCWGYGYYGVLGTGSTASAPAPVAVSGGLSFTQLASGIGDFVCGLTNTDDAYCWGDNSYGQLGDGTKTSRTAPVAVTGGRKFVELSAGGDHACGVTSSGAAYCWGNNNLGQLGNGSTTSSSVPVAVSGSLVFQHVAAGGSTCGVTTSGAAYCWGSTQYVPTAVSGGLAFSAIAVGSGHACGLTAGNVAYCWGDNSWGQLGIDSTTSYASAPRPVAGGLLFQNIAAGSLHTCGLTVGETAYCWGYNGDGQLGDGSQSFRISPTVVNTTAAFLGIAAGTRQSCAFTSAGQGFCWGNDGYGAVGDGTTGGFKTSPVRVVLF